MTPAKMAALRGIKAEWCKVCARQEVPNGVCYWFREACEIHRYDTIFPTVNGARVCPHYEVRPEENGYCPDPRQEPLL